MVKLQIRKFGAISWRSALFVLWSWPNVVRVIGGATRIVGVRVVWAQMGHLASSDLIVRWNYDGLVLSVTSCSRTSPLADWISVMMLRTSIIWCIVDGLVAPVSRVECALWALVTVIIWLLCTWSYTAIWELRWYGLYSRIIEEALRRYLLSHSLVSVCFVACSRDNRLHHEVIGFDDRWMHDCAKLLIVVHLELACLEPAVSIAMLLIAWLTCLSRIGLALGQIHVDSLPCVICVLSIDWLVDGLWSTACSMISRTILMILLHHLCGPHARSCRAHAVLIASMRAYHLILRILRWSMRANACLNRVVSTCVAMSDRHVHSVLYVLLRLLSQLWLVSHMVHTWLTKSTWETH